MMVAKVDSACLLGVDASRVHVEVSLAKGVPRFSIVGLPDASTREAKDRVVAAVRNSGFEFPSRRVTINLAPAELRKEGSVYDLAIAVGVLLASSAVQPVSWPRAIWLGELALDGTLRPVRGLLPIVRSLSRKGWRTFVVPAANREDVRFIDGVEILPFKRLNEVTAWLEGQKPKPFFVRDGEWTLPVPTAAVDLAHVKGQPVAKRALEVAAAGRHNVLFVGCPGTGKTMLAQALPGILPRWSLDDALDASQIHSLIPSAERSNLLLARPFRSPHHSISLPALVGGGDIPIPGEISLAHQGVLFLDELPEFRRDALEALRQPLEQGCVHVHRARGRAVFPANFLLVAAMNPCPCGHRGHPKKECICSLPKIQKYIAKISGPLLDRIDLHVELPVLRFEELTNDTLTIESSAQVRERIAHAWNVQQKRFGELTPRFNQSIVGPELKRWCPLNTEGTEVMRSAMERLGLSARSFDRVRRVARTIADLENSDEISVKHVAEALQYRALDRQSFLVR